MSEIIYADPWVQVTVPLQDAAVAGHLRVESKLPASTLQELTDEQVEHLYFVASYAGTALFELLGVQGTNMLLNETDGFLVIDILARRQDDGLNLLWTPINPSQNELKSTAGKIKDALDIAQWHEKENKKKSLIVADAPEMAKPAVSPSSPGKINYLLKHFRRIP